MSQRALVVGGGIGGLAAALVLRRLGWSVQVLEQGSTDAGGGLQLAPNGTRLLRDWGVLPLIEADCFAPEAIELRLGHNGFPIFSIPMRAAALARWGAPYLQIHRSDLRAGLLRALGDDVPCHTRHVIRYDQDPDQVTLSCADGSRFSAELVIGADGLHSVLRAQMLGPDRPRFTGNVAWRAVVPLSALAHPPPPTGCVWAGSRRHAVTTRIHGGRSVNFVGIVEQSEWVAEGWREKGDRTQAMADFTGFDPRLTAVIAAADSQALYRWALCDRAPLPRWSEGRVALLGDACHPMLPSLAQGAVQALEDAAALGTALAQGGALPAALNRYYQSRIARVSAVQRRSAQNLRLFHQQGLARWLRYGPMAIGGRLFPQVVRAQLDWLYRPEP